MSTEIDPIVAAYLRYKSDQGISAVTYTTYYRYLTTFADWIHDTKVKSMSDLRKKDWFDFHQSCVDNKRYAESTLRQMQSSLSAMCSWMVAQGILRKNPIPDPVSNAFRKKDRMILTPKQLFAIRKKRNQRIHHIAFFECAISSGLRRSELMQLRASDIAWGVSPEDHELKDRSCYYKATVTIDCERMIVKGKRSRMSYLSAAACRAISLHMKMHGIPIGSNVPMFPQSRQHWNDGMAILGDGVVEIRDAPQEVIIGEAQRYSGLDLDTLQLSGKMRLAIEARQRAEQNSDKNSLIPLSRSLIKKKTATGLHPHALRYSCACYLYYRSPSGDRENLNSVKKLLGHRFQDTTFDYVVAMDLVQEDAEWKRIMTGTPSDWFNPRM